MTQFNGGNTSFNPTTPTTTFVIPHGITGTPTTAQVGISAGNLDISGAPSGLAFNFSWDATNITVELLSDMPWSDPISFSWFVYKG